jgi:exoribonuclease-2
VKIFEIVLFFDDGKFSQGVAVEDKGSKLVAETLTGKRVSLAGDRIILRHQIRAATRADAADVLKAALEEAGAKRAGVDALLLWETLLERGEGPYDLKELSDAWHGNGWGIAELKAMQEVLDVSAPHFKRVGGRFKVHSREHVEEALRQKAAEEEHRRLLHALRDELQALREGRRDPAAFRAAPGIAPLLDEWMLWVVEGNEPRPDPLRALFGEQGANRERVLAVLVQAGLLGAPEDVLLLRQKTARDFPAEAEAQAAEVVGVLGGDAPGRAPAGLPAEGEPFTIDDEDTRDFDDAVTVRLDGDDLELGVHIADPTGHVPIGSPLDLEAYARGTTIYLPEGAIPMFPTGLSERGFSLRAGTERPVLSLFFRIAPDGTVTPGRIVRERLRPARNLTYEDVDRVLAEPPAPETAVLRRLEAATTKLREERGQRGALTLHQPELKIRARGGEVSFRRIDPATPSRLMVSELMILANRRGAEFLRDAGVPAFYRMQNPPRSPLQPYEGPYDPVRFRREVTKMERARLTLEPRPHAGLGLPCYTQLTSPIRRFADLAIHRQMAGALSGEAPAYPEPKKLLEIVATSEQNMGGAVDLEKRRKRAHVLRRLYAGRGERLAAVALDPLPGGGRFLAELTEFVFVVALAASGGAAPPPGTPLEVEITHVDLFEEEARGVVRG